MQTIATKSSEIGVCGYIRWGGVEGKDYKGTKASFCGDEWVQNLD